MNYYDRDKTFSLKVTFWSMIVVIIIFMALTSCERTDHGYKVVQIAKCTE